MSMTDRPIDPRDKERILGLLAPALPTIYEAFESGTARTREFFQQQPTERGKQRDPYLAAHLTRYWAGGYLAEKGLAERIDPIWLPNNGVAVRLGPVDVRCLKSFFGQIPGPGRSEVKRAFYNQVVQQPLFLFGPEQERAAALVNIIITWDVDARGSLGRLDVHSPASALRSRDSVRCYWTEELIHPALVYEPEEMAVEQEVEEDLPYYEEERPDTKPETDAG
jgi:hypothetical protein